MDIVDLIRRFNAGRDPERLALKYAKLRADPFAFLRGTCGLFYARLPLEPVLRKAPRVWCCGDLHLENFGTYKGDDRQVYFDLNDFDEALLAPLTWDLVRATTSILVARAVLRPRAATADIAPALCEAFVDAFAQALAQGKARWVERETATAPVSDLLRALRQRTRPQFLDTRTERVGKRRRIRVDGVKALPASTAQHAAVRDLIAGFAATQPKPRFFDVLDVARRIAGTGSLGVERFIVLVRGKGSPEGNYLLDLKRALPSAPAVRLPLAQPLWSDEAQRVVELQQRMQAVSMAFLHPVRMNAQSFVLRALQPSEDRVALAQRRDIGGAAAQPRHRDGRMRRLGTAAQRGRGGSAIADELIDVRPPGRLAAQAPGARAPHGRCRRGRLRDLRPRLRRWRLACLSV
jgi:uncharacterized protein (DUF2252 family)